MLLVRSQLSYHFHRAQVDRGKAESTNSLTPAPSSLLKKCLSMRTLGKSKGLVLLAAK